MDGEHLTGVTTCLVLISSSTMAKRTHRLYDLAKRGAEVRLHELMQEAKHLTRMFPHLRDSFDKDDLPVPFILARGAQRARQRLAQQPRRRMSAAARKAHSQRMKKFWAAKRKAEAKG
jgi:hypothetical protein